MAKFDANQAADVLAMHQLVNDWAIEMDVHNGANMGALMTDDCQYVVRAQLRTSRAEVVAFYKERLASFHDGAPIHRHALVNHRVSFSGADTARIEFSLIYFSTMGSEAGTAETKPFSYADVWMDCRRESDGHWRIASFDSTPVFVRPMG